MLPTGPAVSKTISGVVSGENESNIVAVPVPGATVTIRVSPIATSRSPGDVMGTARGGPVEPGASGVAILLDTPL